MPKKEQIIKNLTSHWREIDSLRPVMGLLSWDSQVNLPKKARPGRQEQIASLASILHAKGTDPRYGEWLQAAIEFKSDLPEPMQICLDEALRAYRDSTKLPEDLVRARARLSSIGFSTWESCKKENHLQPYLPVLQELITMTRDVSSIIRPDLDPYDACLDNYERGLRQAWLKPLFQDLKAGLKKLLQKCQNPSVSLPEFPAGHYPKEKQKLLGHKIASLFGFDFEGGRLDESSHPFSSGLQTTDSRLTTRYDESNFFTGLKSLAHETGHGLYEQGKMQGEYQGLPVSRTLGMMVHESQSLFWERMIFRSLNFWEALWPEAKVIFEPHLHNVSAREFYLAMHRVRPIPVRIDSDEITYPLHILLRHDLESRLIEKSLSVQDLPEAWDNLSLELLGFVPKEDRLKVLQDVHWSDGSFGYFPTYTLGAIYASQLYAKMSEDVDLTYACKNLQFKPVLNWLRQRIHLQGRLQEALPLLENITGQKLDVQIFLNYLDRTYSPLYS